MDEEYTSPLLEEARSYYNHRKYELALEVYSELLPTLDTESIEYTLTLLEYSQCMLDSVMYKTEINYKLLLQRKRSVEEGGIEEDLEICWDSLESCRIRFEVLNDRRRLCLVHKGLGDVHSLNNRFSEAAEEYLMALDYNDEDQQAETEILEDVADAFKNANESDKAQQYYERLIELYQSRKDQEAANEIAGLLQGLEARKALDQGKSKKKKPADSDDEAVNINHLKRK